MKLKSLLKRLSIYDVVSTLFVTLGAVSFMFPIYWLFSSAFKLRGEIYEMPPTWIPRSPTIHNIIDVFVKNPADTWILNSMLVALFTAVLTVITGSMAAYAFSKLNFVGRNLLFILFVASIMIPIEVMIVPLFQIVIALDWQNTIWGMALPSVASAIGMFMMKGFIDSIPDSLRESAKIDGANEFIVFWRIIMPMAKAGIGALFIITFVTAWNNYLWQLLMGTRKASMTLMVGISTLFSEIVPNPAYKVAGAAVGAIPMIIVFFSFQRYFTRGIALGAVKE